MFGFQISFFEYAKDFSNFFYIEDETIGNVPLIRERRKTEKRRKKMIIKTDKSKYRVFVKTIVHDYYGETREETKMLGETWAKSTAKAISNIKYRLGIGKEPESLYAPASFSTYFAIKD